MKTPSCGARLTPKPVHAVQDVKAGDIIFSMPIGLIEGFSRICLKEAFKSQLGDNLDESTPLAVKLLRERALQEQSRYYPYIQVCSSQQTLDCCGCTCFGAVRKHGSMQSELLPQVCAQLSQAWGMRSSSRRMEQQRPRSNLCKFMGR